MATSSIMRNVVISKKSDAKKLVNALKITQNQSAKKVELKKPIIDVKAEDIKSFFGD